MDLEKQKLEIKGALVTFYRNADSEDYLQALNDAIEEIQSIKNINYTSCCETLISKEAINFEDYLQKFYIENGLNYQSKRTGKIVDIDEPKKRYDWYCKYN